ncbi:MAG: thiamine phosphate synthase [Tannerellaceae bacterium]|nr:thiamine phosphate synthase [Tannerellaceae bacterium]MCD8262855.1 thiamine phosphate synthase [Tannerellaceae bacterium]
MKLILIARENLFPEEITCICELFMNGLEILHLRKPSLTRQDTAELLAAIPGVYHPQIVLHDHYELTEQFDLKGVHINRRNVARMDKAEKQTSRSCHSLKEVEEFKQFHEYLFLSPVFNSISKVGYQAGFNPAELEQAGKMGIIDSRVVALGGITPENAARVGAWGFGGIAVLGTIWGTAESGVVAQDVLQRFKRLKTICDAL